MYHRDHRGNFIFSGPVTPAEIFAIADAVATEGISGRTPITDPNSVLQFLRTKLLPLEHEEFHVVFLDARHRVIGFEAMFRGGLTGAAVYVGEVVKAALKRNAAAIVIAHNHPSGISEPSAADRELTTRIYAALNLIEIRLLDHFVIAAEGHTSFAERGWI
jgi:DNA repair protein RadC